MKCIVGAGLAGLVAAHAWPQAAVLEASPQPTAAHRALLRFRTDGVSRLTGIEFRKVRVNKGIWSDDAFVQPNIRVANMYAQKVLRGSMRGDRSIWRLDPVERFIAPDTLYEQLVEAVGSRVSWATPADFAGMRTTCVSTAPLPVTLKALGIEHNLPFRRSGILVRRWTLPESDVFQTIYYPDANTAMYRASITGNTLIAEFVDATTDPAYDAQLLERSFGIDLGAATALPVVEQKYGKIEPVANDGVRKHLLFRLTHDHGIFSLGRFATWRNILLDDVVDDIAAIKRLSRSGAAYDLRAATQ